MAAGGQELRGSIHRRLLRAKDMSGTCVGSGRPLHYAARLGQLRAAQYLLEMGAEVNALNRMGYADSGTVARNRTRVE